MDNIMLIIPIAGITFILYYFCALFWGSLKDIKRKKEKEKEKGKEKENKKLTFSDDVICERFRNSLSICKNCKHVKFIKYIKEIDSFEFYTDCGYPKGEKAPIYCRDFEEREH